MQELSSAALRRSLSEKLFCFSFFPSKVLQLGRGKLQRLPLQRPGKSQLADRCWLRGWRWRWRKGKEMAAEPRNVNRKQTANSAVTLIFTCPWTKHTTGHKWQLKPSLTRTEPTSILGLHWEKVWELDFYLTSSSLYGIGQITFFQKFKYLLCIFYLSKCFIRALHGLFTRMYVSYL